jgi:hypothetical protein
LDKLNIIMSKKPCSISFKSAGDGVPCTTVINGKLVVKGDAVFNKNVTTKKDLNVNNVLFNYETIDESGQEVSPTKSISFINTNGVGELDDACCDGFYKKIVKINDSEEVRVGWTSVGNTGDINSFSTGGIRTIAFKSNGEGPYIGGFFSIVGITGLNNLAKWTGSSWTSIGNTGDFNNGVYTITFDPITDDGPYIGGAFENVAGITGLNYLAKWTGSSWTSIGNTGDIDGPGASVEDIAFNPITGDGPYICGNFENVAGITGLNIVAKWGGTSVGWTTISGNTGDINKDDSGSSIEFDKNGEGPYIGGAFDNVAGITGLNNFAKWGGTSIGWTSIGNTGDIDNFVITITFDQNNNLYIGGKFENVAGITGLDKIAKWTGSSWTSVGNTGDINNTVVTLEFDKNGEGPYICGVFDNVSGINELDHITKWTGSSWTSISGNTGEFSISYTFIYSISFNQYNTLYIGGVFNYNNGISGITGLDYLAKYDTDTSGYKLTYNTTETLTLTNKGDNATLIYNSDPTAGWVKIV